MYFSTRSALSTFLFFFFFNDTATTEIYTLSLHDALPISFGDGAIEQRPCGCDFSFCEAHQRQARNRIAAEFVRLAEDKIAAARDRKSTRLNSSHGYISYAVFCLKKKKKKQDR